MTVNLKWPLKWWVEALKNWKWPLFIVALGTSYIAAVVVFGFHYMGLAIQFGRVTLAVAVLFLFLPLLGTIFREIPAPRRDYLLAGIMLTWASALSFAFWNEAGRQFQVDTNIFTSPIAGFFSLLLVAGGAFHLAAPPLDVGRKNHKLVALVCGLIIATALVLIAPLFR